MLSATVPVTGTYAPLAGVRSSAVPRAAGVRRAARRRHRRRSSRPPQYSPANSTSVPAGGVNVELDELNVAGSASVSTGTIAKLLLLSAAPVAVPACDAAQFAAAAGHVISVLPVTQIAPGSFVLKRGDERLLDDRGRRRGRDRGRQQEQRDPPHRAPHRAEG